MKEQPDKARILIVDDVPKNIQVLGNFLSKDSFQIAYAKSGPEALRLLEDTEFDLILLDIMMPEMDGFEVCSRIKENPKTRNIPVIFLTAKTQKEEIVRGFNIGAQDYITKPFNPQELIARVNTHLDLKRKQEALSRIHQNESTREEPESTARYPSYSQLQNLCKLQGFLLNHLTNRSESDAANQVSLAMEPDGRLVLYTTYLNSIQQSMEHNQQVSSSERLANWLSNFLSKSWEPTTEQLKPTYDDQSPHCMIAITIRMLTILLMKTIRTVQLEWHIEPQSDPPVIQLVFETTEDKIPQTIRSIEAFPEPISVVDFVSLEYGISFANQALYGIDWNLHYESTSEQRGQIQLHCF